MKLSPSKNLGLILAALGVACLSVPAHAQTSTFNGSTSNDYSTAANWTPSGVPNLTTGATALINNGDAVTYTSGPDFVIDNGSTLEISNGSWTQIGGGGWIQMEGTGNILVNGGTFNQGSAGNNPFNVSNSGNVFTITSGAANFSASMSSTGSGITYNFDGGITTISGEMDYNTNNNIIIAGGTVITTLFTAVNNSNLGTFTLSSGELKTTTNNGNSGGFYSAAPTAAPNFTLNSTASIDFEMGTVAQIQGYVTAGDFKYNGVTGTAANFNVTSDGSGGALLTVVAAVPEPSTYVMFGLGFSVLLFAIRRRSAKL